MRRGLTPVFKDVVDLIDRGPDRPDSARGWGAFGRENSLARSRSHPWQCDHIRPEKRMPMHGPGHCVQETLHSWNLLLRLVLNKGVPVRWQRAQAVAREVRVPWQECVFPHGYGVLVVIEGSTPLLHGIEGGFGG